MARSTFVLKRGASSPFRFAAALWPVSCSVAAFRGHRCRWQAYLLYRPHRTWSRKHTVPPESRQTQPPISNRHSFVLSSQFPPKPKSVPASRRRRVEWRCLGNQGRSRSIGGRVLRRHGMLSQTPQGISLAFPCSSDSIPRHVKRAWNQPACSAISTLPLRVSAPHLPRRAVSLCASPDRAWRTEDSHTRTQ